MLCARTLILLRIFSTRWCQWTEFLISRMFCPGHPPVPAYRFGRNPSIYFFIPIYQPSHLLGISSPVSVAIASSSANSSSHGSPPLNSSLMISSTTIDKNGLSPDPCCRPTLMGNTSVLPCVVLTTVDAPWYVASTSLTSLSETPLLLRHQYSRSLGTLSCAFSMSTKVKNRSFCTSKVFSCSCMINTASVVPFLN